MDQPAYDDKMPRSALTMALNVNNTQLQIRETMIPQIRVTQHTKALAGRTRFG